MSLRLLRIHVNMKLTNIGCEELKRYRKVFLNGLLVNKILSSAVSILRT